MFVAALLAVSLVAGFENPPMEARPQTWWHWMNGNVTKEGVSADLEAMARLGLGGATIFDAGCDVPPGPVAFNTDAWYDMVRHAGNEAKRLGLGITLSNCSGWSSSGGPWVKGEDGMKQLVTFERIVKGPVRFNEKLERTPGRYWDIAVIAFPRPPAERSSSSASSRAENDHPLSNSNSNSKLVSGFTCRIFAGRVMDADAEARVTISDDGVNYRPYCTAKVPVATSGFVDTSTRFVPFPRPVCAKDFKVDFDFPQDVPHPSVSNLTFVSKAGISCLSGKILAARINHLPYDDYETTPDQVVRPEDVRDISSRLASDDTLTWDVPAGEWVIVRVGYRLNGRRNHPASRLGVGLEVDKLDAAAVGRHFDAYVGKCCDLGIPIVGTLVDSYEVGSQNWTHGFEKAFAARRGYSLLPYLPAFTGRVVVSPRETERVLADFRRTVGELFAENYAGGLAKKCHERGLALSVEPYGSCPANNLTYGAQADIPQAEFWSFAADPNRRVETGNACLPGYIAHVWGKRYAAAESFSASPSSICGGRWKTTPELIKSQADAVFAAGVNRLIFHRFAHQPWTKPWLRPGMTMGLWGMHFDRTQTWWDHASGWMTYMSRCQWMLQEGTFVADILFFCGEEYPNTGGDVDSDPESVRERPTPFGYRHDLCALDALKASKVENGAIVVPGGVRYRVLSLPHRPVESDELKSVIRQLEQAGATVVHGDPAAALDELKVAPDFICRTPGVQPFWMHRRYPDEAVANPGRETAERSETAEGRVPSPSAAGGGTPALPSSRGFAPTSDETEAYFVACTNETPMAYVCSFRVTGKVPEIWDAETGTRERARDWREANGRTEVTVRLTSHGSKFVVFRKSSDRPTEKVRTLVSEQPVAGPWKLTFPIGHYFGTDEKKVVEKTELVDWTSFEDPDLKYFSGTAEYELETVAEPRNAGRAGVPSPAADGGGTRPSAVSTERIVLDLGAVKNLAEVTVNGKTFPTLWKPPFTVDITDVVKSGKVEEWKGGKVRVTVRVTNLWINRLIGDEYLPEDAEWSPGRQTKWYHNIPIKEIPAWVNEGRRSPTGRHTFTTWKHYTKEDALFPSGLLGPVRLLIYDEN